MQSFFLGGLEHDFSKGAAIYDGLIYLCSIWKQCVEKVPKIFSQMVVKNGDLPS